MRLLLDTHVLLWSLTASPRISGAAKERITDPGNSLICSVATIWEVAIKHARGGDVPFSGTDLLHRLKDVDVEILPIDARHAAAIEQLPRHHGDPFDRMLVAQAREDSLYLLTHDRALLVYGDFVMLV